MTLVDFSNVKIVESREKLVDLKDFDFVLEPYYFKQRLSRLDKILIREGAAERLILARKKLPTSYNFKIWDGWRPLEVQKTVFDKYFNELKKEHPSWDEKELFARAAKFVAPVSKIQEPPHLSGGAIDLTVVNREGEELAMGTTFDEFVEKAGAYFYEQKEILTPEEKEYRDNRRILRTAMLSQNFWQNEDEWWHYDFGNQLWAKHYKKDYAIYGGIKDKF